jgi:hypothetical protein
VLIAVIAVAAGGFAIARSGGDDNVGNGAPSTTAAETTSTGSTGTTKTTTTSTGSTGTTKTTTPNGSAGSTKTTSPATTPAKPAGPPTFTVRVSGGKPAGGIERIRVKKGMRIRIVVKSDVADEIHIHGYDLTKDVTAGGTVSFDFKATIDGNFEIELEGRKEQIAQLTVAP